MEFDLCAKVERQDWVLRLFRFGPLRRERWEQNGLDAKRPAAAQSAARIRDYGGGLQNRNGKEGRCFNRRSHRGGLLRLHQVRSAERRVACDGAATGI